jgi:ribonuclease P/MRP protein subunit POP5
MTKARALKRRYILFEFKGRETDEEALKRSLYAEALKFFGEYGLSFAAVKLVSFDKKSKKGVLRCERDYLERVLGFLALLGSLEGAEARLVALRSSGTLKSLEQDSTQSK